MAPPGFVEQNKLSYDNFQLIERVTDNLCATVSPKRPFYLTPYPTPAKSTRAEGYVQNAKSAASQAQPIPAKMIQLARSLAL
jgi:hypothetical protein